jgi:hypothetical protein
LQAAKKLLYLSILLFWINYLLANDQKDKAMDTTIEYRQNLVAELIDQSARIDVLVVKSREAMPDEKLRYDQELEELRAKQRQTTKKLHELEEAASSNDWENIGDGG